MKTIVVSNKDLPAVLEIIEAARIETLTSFVGDYASQARSDAEFKLAEHLDGANLIEAIDALPAGEDLVRAQMDDEQWDVLTEALAHGCTAVRVLASDAWGDTGLAAVCSWIPSGIARIVNM